MPRSCKAWPSSAKIFFKPTAASYEPGDMLVQTDLAKSLKQIAAGGADAFYRGEIGKLIAAEMARSGGLITMEDLAGYQAIVREPVTRHLSRLRYLLHAAALLRRHARDPDPEHPGRLSDRRARLRQRRDHPPDGRGDEARLRRPQRISRRQRLRRRAAQGADEQGLCGNAAPGSAKRATPSATIKPTTPLPYESDQTTHFSVVDKDGNAVSNTYTLNFSFGTGLVAEGTGILLNNEMDDFSAKPGVPNAYGLIGGDANAVEPGKRPLSSMSPTIVLKDGSVLVTGSPGGSRIITTVLQIVMNVIDHGMNIAEASAAPRMHHQWLPDELASRKASAPTRSGCSKAWATR